MPELIIAALILWLLVYGTRWLARADPKALAAGMRKGLGGAMVAIAGFVLVFRGNAEAAAAIGAAGLWLIGWRQSAPAFLRHFMRPRESGPQTRVFRSATLEIEVDLTSGQMRGRALAGPFAGRELNELTQTECIRLLESCRSADPEAVRFLQFYVNGRFAGRGATGDADENTRWGQQPGARTMSEEYAYELLGLPKGASPEEITRAHRTLMKKVHPDHGGTSSLAALLNEAKDVLIRRHH